MRLTLAVLALGLAGAPAMAECVTAPQLTEQISAQVPGAQVRTAPEGFMAEFNAMPPVTNIPADTVLIFSHPSKSAVLVTMFNGGCWVASQQLAVPQLMKLLAKIAGDGA